MAITASLVKELRELTGVGMMECKKVLVETDGDLEAAKELLRTRGQAKAEKKAGRIAAEGVVQFTRNDNGAVLTEINCETDFVARDENFLAFTAKVAEKALAEKPADLDALMAGELETVRSELVAKIGENVSVRRFTLIDSDGPLAAYIHGGRIGVAVALEGGDEDLARDIAMHIAASNPQYISEADVPADELDKERRILTEQALGEGKPENIVEKMVEGRLRKFLAEITLVGQPFVKDPDTTVGKLLSGASASVSAYYRYEVGEGIEKKQENFAEEVAAQVQASA